jgi:hypothetical protein
VTRFTSIFSKAAIIALLLFGAGARADGIANSGSVTAGQVPGTATNDNASAGNVGEIITATVAQGSAVTLTTATPANITSVSLTAGDWDCNAVAGRTFGATTSITILKSSLNTTSATDGSIALGTLVQFSTPAAVPVTDTTQQIGAARFSLNATTSVFLVADDTFTVSTDKGYGFLRCRRAR